MLVREFSQPLTNVVDLSGCTRISEIACVDEDIAIWNADLSVSIVRIRYDHKAHKRTPFSADNIDANC
jgi:hypothetical protein